MISHWYTHPVRPPAKKIDKSDPQADALYRMEREIVGCSAFTTTEEQVLIDITAHACRKYGVSKPELCFENKPKQRIFGMCFHDHIWLNAGFHGANLGVLLHELAHWIVGEKYTNDIEAHGPTFAKIYRELLDQYRMLPADCFDVLAERYGVQIGKYEYE